MVPKLQVFYPYIAFFPIFLNLLRSYRASKFRYMRLIIAFCLLLCSTSLSAQIGMGQWRMHVAASQAIDIAAGNGYVMAALSGGVLEYDIAAGENRVLNNLNALSDIAVSCIAYEPQSKSFFVGYENGNVDQIKENGVINIPAIKLAEVTGSKRINKIIPYNGLVYVATGFSLVLLNPTKSEVKDSYYPTNSAEGVNDVVFLNDSIYVLTNTKMYRGAQSNQFLADPAQWTTDTRFSVPTDAHYGELAVQQNELHVSWHSDLAGGCDSIFRVTPGGLVSALNFSCTEIQRFQVENELFYLYFPDKLVAFNDDSSVNFGVQFYNSQQAQVKKLITHAGFYWVADNQFGMVRGSIGAGDLYNPVFISREGPAKNLFFGINGSEGKMVVTRGTLNRVELFYHEPLAYTFEDETWALVDKQSQTPWQGAQFWSLSTAAVHPDDKSTMAFGCYCPEGVSLVDGAAGTTMLYDANNSTLETTTLGNGNICVTALEYDSEGNLWVANGYSSKPLKVRLSDGSWQEFSAGSEASGKFTGKMAIDYNGNKWFAVYPEGLIGYNDNETPGTPGDDSYQLLKPGEGLGNLPSENVTAIAVDLDNEIWIGTDEGFAVLYNSDNIFNSNNYDASRILITYEGNVEYLLGSTPITDIEVDGGNRKWIGTESSGIFLLSPDGQEVLAEYTAENSPLISNNIMDMEFNHITGELFIITDMGLVSLRTDASQEDESYATTTVFPNPVQPDYFGPITIQGIRFNSDVKITDAAGNLVYKTTSNGGTATWNGKTLTGEDVASGVYLIWTATNEGKGRKVGKVAIIR